MTVQPHAETSPIDHQQPANARTGESAFLRGAAYVLLVGAVGIILGHMVIKTAMREKMYDHQRVLKALTPMIPDDREGIAADRGPVQIPGADNSVDLRGVAKGALVSSALTDRAYCRGLRPSVLWSDGQRSYQLASMHGGNHDWEAATVLLGAEIAGWLKQRCEDGARRTGVDHWVALTPFDIPAAAYADYDQDMILVVTALPGRREAFDQLLASAAGVDPLKGLMSPSVITDASE
ncbi:MAG: hypothetical protein KDA20_12640 [Phycisphaerales bacterium]|nr:hypothetical protein [Phycisphaerales bacterium]